MSAPQALTIGLFGGFGGGNLGNEGSLEALTASLKGMAPNARLVCICPVPEVVTKEHGLAAIPITGGDFKQSWLRMLNKLSGHSLRRFADIVRVWRTVREFDTVIVPGTGILDDMGEPPFGMPYAIWKWFTCARLRGVPTGFVSMGAGPITKKLSRFFMLGAAKTARYRSYRDQISKDFMLRHGVSAAQSDPVFPDIAFQLEIPAAEPRASAAPLIGVGVMTYYGWSHGAEKDPAIYEAYRAKMIALVIWLLEQGFDVRLIVGEHTDDRALEEIRRGVLTALAPLPAHRLTSAPTHSLHDIMAQMADTDLVVGTRFHNIVCALKLGKPTISLGYAKKNDVLMQEFGLGAFCQHVETFDVDAVKVSVSDLLREKTKYGAGIAAKAQSYRDALRRQEALLGAALLGCGGAP